MAWNSISGYLEKFFTISPPKKFYQGEVIKVFNEIMSIELFEGDVEYRFGVVYIKNNNQILKNEIFLNKEKIIRQLNQKIKNDRIKDIRF
ncbi:MAG: hypothetical protein AAB822_01655 [Patescibacteria group bacterium]